MSYGLESALRRCPVAWAIVFYSFVATSVVPVDGGHAGLLPAQLRVPVLGRVLVVVAKLGLRQERAQLHRLFQAHAQVPVVEVLLHVSEENVPGGQTARQMRGQRGEMGSR